MNTATKKDNSFIKGFLGTFTGVICGVIIGIGTQYVTAWTSPAGTAPGGNVSAPLTTGGATQTKSGAIISGNYFKAPWLCLGNDCRSAWPSTAGLATTAYVNNMAGGPKFGGLFQLEGMVCNGLITAQVNPFTGGFSCPAGYAAFSFATSACGGPVYICFK